MDFMAFIDGIGVIMRQGMGQMGMLCMRSMDFIVFMKLMKQIWGNSEMMMGGLTTIKYCDHSPFMQTNH